MRNNIFYTLMISTFSVFSFAELPEWSYDPGPDPKSKMGKELIDIVSNIPDMPSLSTEIVGRSQKFRPAFGPIPWRMLQGENKVKILFMGQDGTHIAEAAGRPATAGFGGRAQDFASYFGVNEGAAFMNAYSFTIKGQYGTYNSPYIFTKDKTAEVRYANYLDNNFWLISNHLDSPIVQWRNDLIDWIIRNNKDSMKLIVLFGGAARDAVATFVRSKGATVDAVLDRYVDSIQVPETNIEYAGGNNTYPSLVGKDGKDLYERMLGRKLNYSKLSDQKAVVKHLEDNLEKYMSEMVFTKGGKNKNGMINPAQLGGYDLDTMNVLGQYTRSLKGLMLNDGSIVKNDIIIISLPHPSSLSRTVMDAGSYSAGLSAASARVMRDVDVLKKYADKGWNIEADPGKINQYALGLDYEYGRSDIGPEFYDFGTPANRMVSKSTAKRMSGAANVVIIGTRDNGKFSRNSIKEMTDAMPADGIDQDQLFIARPSGRDRYVFDSGPGESMARLMIENLNFSEIYEEKTVVKCLDKNKVIKELVSILKKKISNFDCGDFEKVTEKLSFDKNGIEAYSIKSHPSVSDFGHYRGNLLESEYLILADPFGYDDIITARALTGSRGQYLQTVMDKLGVNDKYAVLKTVPFAMDEANDSEWGEVIELTKTYREEIFSRILERKNLKILIADGENAYKEAKRILKNTDVKIVFVKRNKLDPAFGVEDMARSLGVKKFDLYLSNIPRSHLSFYSRVWEGTSGDRVITSEGTQYKGLAFAEVVPSWAYDQELKYDRNLKSGVDSLKLILMQNKLPMPYESIPKYLKRMEESQENSENDAA